MQKLDTTKRCSYSLREYALRLLWMFVQGSIWRICWHRIPLLRTMLLRLFGAKVDGSVLFHGSSRVLRPYECKIGKFVAVGARTHLYNLAHLEIGDHTVISQDAYICGGSHDYTSPDLPLLKRDIVIGQGVWICAGAFIGPGVTIGDGAVVGARAVVMKDVPAMSVVVGNPAQVVKQREVTQ